MYAYQNNILSIPARLLYKEWELMSYDIYLKNCHRGKLTRTKQGHGQGNEAMLSFYDLPEAIKIRCINELGDPSEVISKNDLEDYIFPCPSASKFFDAHRKPDGKQLSEEKRREKVINVMVLNAVQKVFKERGHLVKKKGKGTAWQNILEAVNTLPTERYPHTLPGNIRSFQRKYKAYLKEGYSVFIHKGEGSKNAEIIKGEIADFILAQYALPIKLTIPEVLERYDIFRLQHKKDWKPLSNSAVYQFLFKPENERIWTLGRHKLEAYKRKFQHSLSRDRSNWFPNAYLVIDGTKLDWIHFWEASSNNMGAKLKIDLCFDVYSEKIIGWSLSFTEDHKDHFKTIKMAINQAGCRPYYLTYDNQSGHKMKRMQNLYDSLVAVNGGTHHAHKPYAHSSPAEGLIGRFQKQVIKKFWYSDGQGITVRREDNKPNIDFITANKDLLKTTEQLEKDWLTAVNIWNDKKHPHFKDQSRNAIYQHEMPQKEPLQLWDIIGKFWITQKERPIKYHPHGLNFQLGDDKRLYEVYTADGDVDMEFRRKWLNQKFIVRYDPEYLDEFIQLCRKDDDGNIVHIATASPKHQHENIPAFMKPGDKERWAKDYKVREDEYQRDTQTLTALQKRTGITPQQEIEDTDLLVKFKGNLSKVQRLKVEAEENLSIASRL